MNMRESGPAVYAAGGVLIYGWRRSDIATGLWPAKNNSPIGQAAQKVRDASVGFQVEGGAEITIAWHDAKIFDVSQNDFHAFLLARRKLSHGATLG